MSDACEILENDLPDVRIRVQRLVEQFLNKMKKEKLELSEESNINLNQEVIENIPEAKIDPAFLKFVVQKVQERLLVERQRYSAMKEEVLGFQKQLNACMERTEKMKENLQFIKSMTNEAREWIDKLQTKKDNPPNVDV